MITLKIDFHFENPNRGKRQPRLLALFLLSGVFIGLEKYKKKYTKNRENNKPSHNLLLQHLFW